MLQKSKSKNVFQLKYLLLVPLVFGMLAYTSIETFERKDISEQQTPEDVALIVKINKEIEEEIAKTGSLKKVFHKWKDMYNDPILNGGLLTKEMYFKQEIITERLSKMYRDSLIKAKTPFFTVPKSIKKRIPSTARYQSYVQHTKAFQLLDKNLQYSIENRFQNGGTSIRLLDKNRGFNKGLLVVEVENVKDLTGDEVRTFNTKISEIFETKTSKYKGLVLTDGQHSFEVFDLDLGETVAIENSGDKKSEIISFGQVEKVPVFPGCENETDKRVCFNEMIQKHISDNFQYPKAAQDNGIQGKVYVLLAIGADGMVKDLKMRGPDALLTNEAKRIISRLPQMQPGEHKGKKVQVAYSIPIFFKLNSNTAKNEGASQEYNEILDVPFSVVEEVPIFPGCEGAADKRKCFNEMMQKHIAKNFRYPKEAQDKGIQGRVNLLFVIGKDGVIKNLRMRGPDVLLENEAERIINLLPNMTAGKQKEKKVNVPYSIPISFRLAENLRHSEPDVVPFGSNMFVKAATYNNEGTRLIAGVVSDGKIGLPGVNITINGNVKIVTDFEGKFATAIRNGDILVFEFQELPKVNLEISDKTDYSVSKDGFLTELPQGNQIIYLIDGVETTKKYVETINSDDIESINVLKDKMATDKYGEKAKDGVIEITLKKKD